MDNFPKIKELLSERFGASENTITPAARLTGDLNLSRIEILDLLTILAKEFHFHLPDELPPIETVEDLTSFVEQNSEDL